MNNKTYIKQQFHYLFYTVIAFVEPSHLDKEFFVSSGSFDKGDRFLSLYKFKKNV